MKIKTSELTGAALDWAVAKALGTRTYVQLYEHTMTGRCVLDADLVDMATDGPQELRYSRDWAQGGPIIEREWIELANGSDLHPDLWAAYKWSGTDMGVAAWQGRGPTPLIAAMRCFVASRLGDEVEVPDELA